MGVLVLLANRGSPGVWMGLRPRAHLQNAIHEARVAEVVQSPEPCWVVVIFPVLLS